MKRNPVRIYHCEKKDLTTFAFLKNNDSVNQLYASENNFSDFTDLPESAAFLTLDLHNTKIENFKGAHQMESLRSINLSGSPVTRNTMYKTAVLLAFGAGIREIDGERVTAIDRKIASQYGERCAGLVRLGWMPTPRPPKTAEEFAKIQKSIGQQNRRRVQPKIKVVTHVSQREKLTKTIKLQEMEIKELERSLR